MVREVVAAKPRSSGSKVAQVWLFTFIFVVAAHPDSLDFPVKAEPP